MSLLIRALLIWLLVLAVPAQGAAAATMAFCGPNHHGGGAAAQMQPAAAAGHAHQNGVAAQGHEHHQTAALADEESVTPAVAAASVKVGDVSKHKCSACASCCSVSAMLNTVLAVPAQVFMPAVFSTVVPSVDAFAADGPDRPPRFVLA